MAAASETKSTPTTSPDAVTKDRFIFEHVWKTGGTELCQLARANGWKVPDTPGCTRFFHPHQGWPPEDYDIVGNEGAIPSGKVESHYETQYEFVGQPKYQNWTTVPNVKWITMLRHPFSRSLSHYGHVIRNKEHQNMTLEEFLTVGGHGHFADFIPNQQTRWHCGTGACSSSKNKDTPEFLQLAMVNLQRMDAVLILEDMKKPDSCTRRQMRWVLKFKKVEAFEEKNDNHSKLGRTSRHQTSDWVGSVRPFLNDQGQSVDGSMHWFDRGTDNSTKQSASMAGLGLKNDLDMQLYGYARHLCEVLADKYDREAAEKTANFSNSYTANLLSGSQNGTVASISGTVSLTPILIPDQYFMIFVVANIICMLVFVVRNRKRGL